MDKVFISSKSFQPMVCVVDQVYKDKVHALVIKNLGKVKGRGRFELKGDFPLHTDEEGVYFNVGHVKCHLNRFMVLEEPLLFQFVHEVDFSYCFLAYDYFTSNEGVQYVIGRVLSKENGFKEDKFNLHDWKLYRVIYPTTRDRRSYV